MANQANTEKPEDKEIVKRVESAVEPPKEIRELSQANYQDQLIHKGLLIAFNAVKKEMLAIEANVRARSIKIQAFLDSTEKSSVDKPIPNEQPETTDTDATGKASGKTA